MPTELAELAGQLELQLRPGGTPANPLVVIALDDWRDAPPGLVERAGALVAGALPVTVGVLTGPPPLSLEPLITAATLTLAARAAAGERTREGVPAGDVSGGPDPGGALSRPRPVVPVEDVPGGPDLDGALSRPRPVVPVEDVPGKPDLDGALSRPRPVVPVEDVPGGPDLDAALARLRAAVERSPRAAIACGQLVRQTAVLDTAGGLAAEAAAYSLLLGGPEFARWLGERGAPRHRDPPAEPVRVSRDGGRLAIVFNDSARRNAFSARMREALLDALLVGAADETVESVELSGAGPAFCSGGDLDEFGAATDLAAAYLVRLSRAPWRVIDGMAAKVTVTVQGACVGAGIEMAAYAGRVVAAEDTFFALPEVQMGLVPGAGGSVSVPRRIGRWRAAWMMLTGDRLPAATALRWGLVDEVTPGAPRR